MLPSPCPRFLALLLAVCVLGAPASAITLDVDYTYDTSNFFGGGNPQGPTAGAQARAALEAAAGFFSSILNDTFAAIVVPPPYHSTVSDGVMYWYWTMGFDHPTTGAPIELTNPPLAANEYRIYAGVQGFGGNTAGQGGPGGVGWGNYIEGANSWGPGQVEYIEQVTDNFFNLVDTRGEPPSDFARWGGTISFDNNARSWHYDHTTQPSLSTTDFYSVALHELAHALGFGSSDEWQEHVDGSTFDGINAQAKNNNMPVELSADLAHWAMDTTSVVYGGTMPQEAAMDPDLQNGSRKRITELDAAALRDIGWELIPLPGLTGDYNNNGVIDAADYVVWRDKLGQSVTIPNDMTPGTVTAGDYTVWRAAFGKSQGSGSAAAAATPEPVSATLVLMGAWMALASRGYPIANRRS